MTFPKAETGAEVRLEAHNRGKTISAQEARWDKD